MDDLTLKGMIEDELEWEPKVDAADIGVTVEDGVVTLLGHVRTFAEKVAAEEAVARVKGVRAVSQEIEVDLPGAPKTTDHEIAARAADVLDWDTSLPSGQIRTKVQNGYVTLSGEVEWKYQSDQAKRRIGSLPGVKGIVDLIKVKPRVVTEDVKERIESALKRNAELEAKAINVSVQDGEVTLEGHIDGLQDREAATKAAWSAPGVKAVVDNLRMS